MITQYENITFSYITFEENESKKVKFRECSLGELDIL